MTDRELDDKWRIHRGKCSQCDGAIHATLNVRGLCQLGAKMFIQLEPQGLGALTKNFENRA